MRKIKINNIEISKTSEVLFKLSHSITHNEPFGLTRFGDGTIKAIHAFLNEDYAQLRNISDQEGIPITSFGTIINFWKVSANHCNYVDTPEVYFSNKFWDRTKGLKKKKMSEKTILRLKMWKDLYSKIGIINTNYCNPEVNFLSCLFNSYGRKSLPDIMRGKKICCITSRDVTDVKTHLSQYKIDVIKIAGKYEKQYEKSFNKVTDKIDRLATEYDLWLIAAGELGRIYPGLIKFKGGRAFDIGSLIDFWCTGEIPSRLKPYLSTSIHNPLKFILTELGKEYLKFL